MACLVGKKLGKVIFLGEEWPERHSYKYPGKWYRIRCDCGVERLIPKAGSAGYRSCGCSQFERIKITAPELTKHFPDRVTIDSIKDQIYADL